VAAKHFLLYGITTCYRIAGMHQLAGTLTLKVLLWSDA